MWPLVKRLASVSLNPQTPIRSMAAAGPSLEEQGFEDYTQPPRQKLTEMVPKPPRKYSSPFALFVKENCVRGIQSNPIMKRLAIVWARLSEDEKQIYRDSFKKEMSTYEERYEAFKQNLNSEEINLMTRLDKYKFARIYSELQKIARKPKAATGAAYQLFLLDHYRHEDGSRLTEDEYEKKLGHPSIARGRSGPEKLVLRTKELARKWSLLGPEERKPYRERFQQRMAERREVCREWEQNIPRTISEKYDVLHELRRAVREDVLDPRKIENLKARFEKLEERGVSDGE